MCRNVNFMLIPAIQTLPWSVLFWKYFIHKLGLFISDLDAYWFDLLRTIGALKFRAFFSGIFKVWSNCIHHYFLVKFYWSVFINRLKEIAIKRQSHFHIYVCLYSRMCGVNSFADVTSCDISKTVYQHKF